MKRTLLPLLFILLLTGCQNKKILGTWSSSRYIEKFGTVTEMFEFKKNGECIRTLEYGNTLTFDCTYEISKEGIKIIWDEKKDKVFEEYEYIDKDTIKINGGEYKKVD